MTTNDFTPPSTAAALAAFRVGDLWDRGFSRAAVEFNKKVYLCSEINGYASMMEVNTGRILTSSFKSCPGQNSVVILAGLLDKAQRPTDIDYSLVLENARSSINFPPSEATVEECADWACVALAYGLGGQLPPASAAVLLGCDAYGFPEEDAIEFAKLYEQEKTAHPNLIADAIYSAIREMSLQQAMG